MTEETKEPTTNERLMKHLGKWLTYSWPDEDSEKTQILVPSVQENFTAQEGLLKVTTPTGGVAIVSMHLPEFMLRKALDNRWTGYEEGN